jgi:hypothetical protein
MSMVGYDNYIMMIIMRIGLALLAWHVSTGFVTTLLMSR